MPATVSHCIYLIRIGHCVSLKVVLVGFIILTIYILSAVYEADDDAGCTAAAPGTSIWINIWCSSSAFTM
jgi:hypothetical protein